MTAICIIFNFIEFHMLINIEYTIRIANTIKIPWADFSPYRAVPKSESEENPTILLFGNFYIGPLLPELDTCEALNKSIVRSSVCVPHSAVIVHFMHYNHYLNKCKNYTERYKAIVIIYAMVWIVLIQEPPHKIRKLLKIKASPQNNQTLWMFSFHRSSVYQDKYFSFSKSTQNNFNISALRMELEDRFKSSVSIISNCNVKLTPRLKYIRDVKEHFMVYGHGKCYNYKFPKPKRSILCRHHMFYFSFENSLCEDYLTEKYCVPLNCVAIPIIMSHPSNLDRYIPGSYINAFDFPSPKHLGDHLKNVSQNFLMYLDYFRWREKYQIEECKISTNICEKDVISLLKKRSRKQMIGVEEILSNDICLPIEEQFQNLYRDES
ncbi:Alpha-(1,3)-fucosyltransferase 6 [Thelohanellus kitauei]|uniref:Fucosyltransferase n=1 Tax=Thelohanellus kitauei TaxID=669202 RepID=A0A0C2IL87_THEKT|nr:Alpha-(1,3)-fucosyltransferase 6 [Thelohanellus kitauei]